MAFNINIVDQASIDAFGRGRVSEVVTLFDSKQLFDGRTVFWSVSTATGGTTTYNTNRASTSLNVTSTNGSQAIRQTKRRFNYAPGKSLMILNSFIMGATASGITKRAGYFDANNGLFLLNNGGTLSVVVRSNVTGTPTDIAVAQSSWNIDKLDGTGSSGLTLDVTKIQIFMVDFEWLGSGRIRFGFIINGKITYVHQVLNANNLSSVYMSTSNLPCRYELNNVSSSSSSTFECICTSVVTEGATQPEGLLLSADRGVTALASVTSASQFPLVSIRLDNTKTGATITPINLSVLASSGTTSFRWALILNPTVAGTDAASWTSITGSAVQYDVSRTTTNTLTGGTTLASGYSVNAATVSADFNTVLTLGVDLTNTSDQLVLAVQTTTGTDSFLGSVTWREFE
jgi:hypothetical protein